IGYPWRQAGICVENPEVALRSDRGRQSCAVRTIEVSKTYSARLGLSIANRRMSISDSTIGIAMVVGVLFGREMGGQTPFRSGANPTHTHKDGPVIDSDPLHLPSSRFLGVVRVCVRTARPSAHRGRSVCG